MAARKRPQTAAVKDSSVADHKDKTALALPKNQFDNVIRFIKRGHIDNVTQLRNATFLALKQLAVKRDKTKAVGGIPAGSDQVDVGSLVAWMAKVEPRHKVAVKQIIAIDATAVARSA